MQFATPLGLWTFGSAGMLLWGLAAAVPLLIHLWHRRRYQETPWAAMDFLLASLRTNARRLRFEQWLLLCLRMLLVVAFAAAIADPLILRERSSPGVAGAATTRHILVCDTSYSMAFRHRDQTCFQAAQDAMRKLLEQSREGDSFCLVLMQDPPTVVVAKPTSDRRQVNREIDRIRLSDGGADLHAALEIVQTLLGQISSTDVQPEPQRVHFFTDLGRVTWDDVAREDCRQSLRQIANVADLVLSDVGLAEGSNLAVTDLRSDKSSVAFDESMQWTAEVTSFGRAIPENLRIQFLVDQRVVEEKAVTLSPNGRASATADILLRAPGDHAIEARLSQDSLEVDNARWRIFPVRESIQVLCVQGEPEAADYVALALNPGRSVAAPILVEVATESAILDRRLADADCVILNNVARVGPDEAVALRRFLEDGGGLVVVLGDRVQADNYNRQLGDAAGTNRILPAEVGPIERGGEQYFDPLQYKHSVVAAFRGHESAGLLTVPTWRYFKLRVDSPSAITALAFQNGDPAIVSEGIGRGRSILVATALSPSSVEVSPDGTVPWSALPSWPSFPPLVHGLVHEAISGRNESQTVEVLSPLIFTTPDSSATSATVTLPDGTSRQMTCTADAAGSRCVFGPTLSRGIYRVQSGSQTSPRMFAVNLDTRESDLTRLDPTRLPREFQPQDIEDAAASRTTGDSRSPLFRILLGAVAVLMIAESVFACWFARRMT